MNAEPLTKSTEMAITSLQPFNEITQLNEWLYEKIAVFVTGNILEIGSGTGNISNLFIRNDIPVTLSDPEEHYCQLLGKKYDREPLINNIRQIDLTVENFEEIYCDLLGSFDTVLSLNMAEHFSHDSFAIANAKRLLAPGGYLILPVPAYAALYRELDQGLDRWHKYNKQHIKKFLAQDFKVVKTRYFNLIGIVRLFLSGAIVKNNIPAGKHQSRYHQFVPTFFIEDLAFKQIGLSVITVAQKILL